MIADARRRASGRPLPPVRQAAQACAGPSSGPSRPVPGALCIVQRGDGSVLLVRHSYNRRWGTVGGLAKFGENPDVAAVREAREEVGIEVVTVGEPAVVVIRACAGWTSSSREARSGGVRRRCSAVFRGDPRGTLVPGNRVAELSDDATWAWNALARAGLIDPPPS
ncbi:MAG: NUDIX domain-containing protein [Microthrixaceae bacterium]